MLCMSNYINQFPQGCCRRCFAHLTITIKYPLVKDDTHFCLAGAHSLSLANPMDMNDGFWRRPPWLSYTLGKGQGSSAFFLGNGPL